MRALAEVENVRKRAARDIEQAHKYALERFANDLVGVKDSLELGLASEGTLRGAASWDRSDPQAAGEAPSRRRALRRYRRWANLSTRSSMRR